MKIQIQKDVLLAPYTSFRIGGPAALFASVRSRAEMRQAVSYAQRRHIPVRVLGGGTNVLVSDAGFPGLVIRAEMRAYRREGRRIIADAGVSMGELVGFAEKEGLTGLEWAGGLPGTLGGAIYGNAGCYGGEIANSIRAISVLDQRGQVRTVSKRGAHFGYRTSRFKKTGEVILGAELILAHKTPSSPTPRDTLHARNTDQPIGVKTEGCVFKNVEVLSQPLLAGRAFRKKPDMRAFVKDLRIPSGYLIEHAGLKGFRLGNVGVSDHHANFVVNYGSATADEMQILVSLIKQKVRRTFGLLLEEEVQLIGFASSPYHEFSE
ncbi:MAG: UDP-N-acetylmuramate dehydrogenase [Parcubacteria group bacterium]|nr:UDP-N-acetylmuramate dehydrogenase [Parcubacteria group bacterium]